MLKAAFLIIVFFLNTVVGFACVLGADLGFNRIQHAENVPHHHEKTGAHHHNAGQKHDCCKDEVTKLTTADKETRSAPSFSFQHSVLAILPTPIYIQDSLSSIAVNIPNTYFARHNRPPIPDVRIAIQSFQI